MTYNNIMKRLFCLFRINTVSNILQILSAKMSFLLYHMKKMLHNAAESEMIYRLLNFELMLDNLAQKGIFPDGAAAFP